MKPIALCLEPVDRRDEPLTRCVALAGRQPGLRISAEGAVRWRVEDDAGSIELWVTADARLALYRTDGAPCVELHRAKRRLEVPFAKPVILVDGDEVRGASWAYCIHIHGETEQAIAPEPVAAPRRPRRLLRTTAAALAVAALGSQAAAVEPLATGTSAADAGADAAGQLPDAGEEEVVPTVPIEIREHPPAPPPPPVRGGCCGTKPGYDTAFKR
ncbi:MAG: hypothetical protein HY898_04150 [Deltaproteobacteria bacterium]|nr:hypothetical protein [Deltaproteobacteria bacterium]